MGVDIISISWGFDTTQPKIEEALKLASSKDILIFASASNDGRNKKDLCFPAKLSFVFAIGAADVNGTDAGFSPPRLTNDYQYSVLGVGVSGKSSNVATKCDPSDQQGRSFSSRVKSGCSFATPIAVGITALLLSFLRSYELCPRGPAVRSTITKLFLAISSASKNKDYRNLCPWVLCEGIASKDILTNLVTILNAPPGTKYHFTLFNFQWTMILQRRFIEDSKSLKVSLSKAGISRFRS